MTDETGKGENQETGKGGETENPEATTDESQSGTIATGGGGKPSVDETSAAESEKGSESSDTSTESADSEKGQSADKGAEAGAESESGDESGEESDDASEEESGLIGAPEGEYEVEFPEHVEVDEETRDEFLSLAREANLGNEAVQRMIDMQGNLYEKAAEQAEEQHNQIVEGWRDEVTKDKELGGDNFDTTIANVQRAMTRFGSDELKSVLDKSGLGNHPEVVRVFKNIGKAMAEDDLSVQNASTGQKESPAQILFPDMENKQ